jgi:hypothetical protein
MPPGMRFTHLAHPTFAIALALLGACADEDPGEPLATPTVPAPANGTAVFSSLSRDTLSALLNEGVIPAPERMQASVDRGFASATGDLVGAQCPRLSRSDSRSYELEGPCENALADRYEGAATAINTRQSTRAQPDPGVDPSMPSIYQTTGWVEGNVAGFELHLDGRSERSSPVSQFEVGVDVTLKATLEVSDRTGLAFHGEYAIRYPIDAIGFRFDPGTSLRVEGVGTFQLAGEIERGLVDGRPTVTGRLELRGKETLRATYDDEVDGTGCIELQIDDRAIAPLCP